MRTFAKSALVAITTAALGATALLPAYAQPFGGGAPVFTQRIEGGHARSFRPEGHGAAMMGYRRSVLDALVSGRGAEAIDVAAVRLTHQLSLDDSQKELLEDLRVAALSAIEELQAAREEVGAVAQAETPDLIARYSGMVAMTTARADALETMQPAFEAFVSSLDDDQIAQLAARHPMPGRTAPANDDDQRASDADAQD